jgi:hypothetical protein
MKHYLQRKEGKLKMIKNGLPLMFVGTRVRKIKIIITQTNLTI